MKNENLLGAPTEGLGQTVTFAFSGVDKPRMDAGSGVPSVNTGVQGGNRRLTVQASPVTAPPNPTLGLLVKLGEDIMRPRMEQARTARFVDGMQRAMQGEAISDIAESDPWYANIFGKSDTVEGARQYLGNTRAQEVAGSMEDQMPELRKMQPQEAREYFTGMVTKSLTGDKAADQAILSSLTRVMPSVMRRQAKEHHGYQQEQASAAEASSFKSGAKALQGMSSGLNSTVKPEEFKAQSELWLQSLLPVMGRDEENYKSSMTANIIEAANNGWFHAVNALAEPREGGGSFLDVLKPEQRVRVDAAVRAAESRARADAPVEFLRKWSEIDARSKAPVELGGYTAAQVADEVKALNAEWSSKTGIKSDFIPGSTEAQLLQNPMDGYLRERERVLRQTQAERDKARTQAEKDEAQVRGVNQIVEVMRSPVPVLSGVLKDDDIQQAFEALRSSNIDPDEKLKVLARVYQFNPGKKDTQVRAQVEGAIRGAVGADDPDAMVGPLTMFRSMEKVDRAMAHGYAGEYAGKMASFSAMLGAAGPGDPQYVAAFKAAFVNPALRGPGTVPAADRKEVAANVKARGRTLLSRFFTNDTAEAGPAELYPSAQEFVTDLVEASASSNKQPGVSWELATRTAIDALEAKGLRMMGGHAWVDGDKNVPLNEWLNASLDESVTSVPPSHQNRLVSEFFKAQAERAGIEPTQVRVQRLRDEAGEPVFGLIGEKDGEAVFIQVRGSEMRSHYKPRVQAAPGVPIPPQGNKATPADMMKRPLVEKFGK